MTTTRPPRDRQRGNSMLLALIVLSALATLGSLTVVSVQSSLKTSTNDRAQTIARYAAESGAAAAMDFLRNHFDPLTGWSAYVRSSNLPFPPPLAAPDLPSSGAQPGSLDNLFSADQNAWFSVTILNNRNDSGFATGADNDAQVILRSTGHGPQGSVAIIEWEVARIGAQAPPPPPALPPPPPPPWPAVAPFVPLVLVGWRVVL